MMLLTLAPVASETFIGVLFIRRCIECQETESENWPIAQLATLGRAYASFAFCASKGRVQVWLRRFEYGAGTVHAQGL